MVFASIFLFAFVAFIIASCVSFAKNKETEWTLLSLVAVFAIVSGICAIVFFAKEPKQMDQTARNWAGASYFLCALFLCANSFSKRLPKYGKPIGIASLSLFLIFGCVLLGLLFFYGRDWIDNETVIFSSKPSSLLAILQIAY